MKKPNLAYCTFVLAISITFGMSCKQCSPTNGENTPTPGTWEFLGLKGKFVRDLVLAGDDLYACAGQGGLIRLALANNDTNWQYLGFEDSGLPGVTSVYVDSSIFVGIAQHEDPGLSLFRSDDFGATWVPSDSGIRDIRYPARAQVFALAGSPEASNALYAGLSSSIYKSSDSGLYWQLVHEGIQDIRSIRINPSDGNDIWAAGESGRETSLILHSNDGGLNWEEVYPYRFLLPYDITAYDVAVDPWHGGGVYTGTSHRIAKSTDNGQSWQEILEFGALKLAIDPGNPNELWATTVSLHRTLDAGLNWEALLTLQDIGLPVEQTVFHALAVDWEKRVLYLSIVRLYSNHGWGVYKLYF